MAELTAWVIFGMVAHGAMAADQATRDEVVEKCKAAAVFFKENGSETALAKINDKNGAFVWKDTYVFAVDLDHGKVLAHPIKPGLIGKVLVGLKDINGKMFFNELILVGKSKGEGWVDYMWPKPGEKKPSPKNTFVYKVEGENIAVLAGVYE